MCKLGAWLMVTIGVLACQSGRVASAEDKADAIVDRAINALGGESQLRSFMAFSWKSKGRINFGGVEADLKAEWLAQGLERSRQVFEVEINGNTSKAVTVLNGESGWRDVPGMLTDLDEAGVAGRKRAVYLQVIPVVLLPLKSKEFKVETVGEAMVDDKPAVAIKVTGPDEKSFELFFDKRTGLPVKQTAEVGGSTGEKVSLETIFGAYKDFDGIKKATQIRVRRNGQRFIELEITEFKPLREVDPESFTRD